ncbi:MAG TPA: leucine--tRNA ligase, partial [Ruminococcaceae bacterium]|nr:leucine--tRNA ligase [Oscillospiraceae bacterium]
WYNGGMEHVTRHMIYSRFWHRFLYDIGVVPFKEPYLKRTAQGLILGPDGVKMSKSRGNVIDPNEVVDVYGADVLRTYVLFMGDYEQAAPWSESSVKGCKRFVDRLWKLQDILCDGDEYSAELSSSMHKTIKKVTEDIEQMKFNTAIAAVMTLLNTIYDNGKINRAELHDLLLIVNPFAPHITEEMWSTLGFGEMMAADGVWPTYDEAKCIDATVEIVVQINGKIRAKINVPVDISNEDAVALAKEDDKIKEELAGKNIIKEIYVKGKLVNIVAK